MVFPVGFTICAEEVQYLTPLDFKCQHFLTDSIVNKVIKVKGEAFLLKAFRGRGDGALAFSAKKLVLLEVDRFVESANDYVVKFFSLGVEGEIDQNVIVLKSFDHFERSYNPSNLVPNIYHAKFLVEGLNKIHSSRHVHGAISPSNLLIGSDSKGRVKRDIVGFKGAFYVNDLAKQSRIKDLRYISPENLFLNHRNNAVCLTRAADLFSLGLTLFYIITGWSLWDLDLATIGAFNPEGEELSGKEHIMR